MLAAATGLAGAGGTTGRNRIDRPEGYIQFEGDAGVTSGKGSYSVVPAERPRSRGEKKGDDGVSDEDQMPPAPYQPTPQEVCQPQADRFTARLSALRGNGDAGNEALDPAVQRAMFGRTALYQSGSDSTQPVPELTWDDELKDLYRAYQKCVQAQQQIRR